MKQTDKKGIAISIPVRRLVIDASDPDIHTLTQRDNDLIRDLRYVMQENQTQFWRRFGVTQTQGSRFERGRSIPLPVLLLMRLYLLRMIDDTDLQQVSSPGFAIPPSQPAMASRAG